MGERSTVIQVIAVVLADEDEMDIGPEDAMEPAAAVLSALEAEGFTVARLQECRSGPYPWVWSETEQAVCFREWDHGDDEPVFRLRSGDSQ